VFSDDLEAHNAAVKEFQLKRRADYRSSPAPVVPASGAGATPTAEKPATDTAPVPESTAPQPPPAEPPPFEQKTPEPGATEQPDAPNDSSDKVEKKGEQSPQ
jgi:UPF0755 protein